MKIPKIVILAGVLALLGADAALAYNFGANVGREEVRSVRAEFSQTRSTTTQSTDSTQSANPSTQSGQTNPRGQSGQFTQPAPVPPGAQTGRGVSGTVKSVKENTLEVTLPNGNVVDVSIDAQTQIQKTSTGALADIKPGMPITVVSDQNPASNKVTARMIQLRPNDP